jgi:hypothetical protein
MADNISSLIYYLINLSPENGKTPIDNKYEIRKFMRDVLFESPLTTRYQLQKTSSGCKFWQLFIAMLIIIQSKNAFSLISILATNRPKNSNKNYKTIRPYYDILTNTCRGIYANIQRIPDFNALFNNIVSSTNPLLQNFTNSEQFKYGTNYFCVYNESSFSNERLVSHYFTIVILNGQYWLTSSYGSDFVCVPAYTSLLDIERFYAFIKALYDINNEENWSLIQEFYHHYFFQGNIPVQLSEDLHEFYGKELFKNVKGPRLIAGPNIEMKHSLERGQQNQFRVGIIPAYEAVIDSIYGFVMSPPNPSSGGKIKRKSKKTRKRNKK